MKLRWIPGILALAWMARTGFAAAGNAGSLPPDAAPAAHVAEREPRPGEQRFNRLRYRASHNSFERNESLTEQMDHWNVWCLELDLWWSRPDVLVAHDDPCGVGCCPCKAASLDEELDEIAASVTKHGRVTVIDLQLHLPESGTEVFYATIRNSLRSKLGSRRIYRPADFAAPAPDGDGLRWPSYQEMVRRGKNFVVVAHPAPEDSFFFRTTSTFPPSKGESANAVLAVVENAATGPGNLGDRYLSRTWHGSCAGFPDLRRHCSCEIEDGFWNRSVALGFNFIATYCVDRDTTFTAPMPIGVQDR